MVRRCVVPRSCSDPLSPRTRASRFNVVASVWRNRTGQPWPKASHDAGRRAYRNGPSQIRAPIIGTSYDGGHDNGRNQVRMSHSGATQQSGGQAEIRLRRESPAGGPEAAGAGTPSRRRLPNWLNPFGGKQWKWRRGWTRVLIATQVFAAVLLTLRALGVLQSAELGIYDRLVVAWSHPEITDRVVIVAITEDDIGTLGWPLRDADLAALLSRLTGLGARAVGIDLYRDRPLPPGSEELAQIREQHPEINWVIKLADKNNNGIMPSFLIPNKLGALADVVTDPGGVVRRGLMAAEEAATGRTVLALGTRMAQRYLGKSMRDADDGNAMIGNGEINLINETWGPYAHVDASGYQTLLDFRGGTDRFRRISYARM